jgi:hypothetical protein
MGMERFDRGHVYFGMGMIEVAFVCAFVTARPGGLLAVALASNILGATIIASKLNFLIRHRDELRAQLLDLHKVPVSVLQ